MATATEIATKALKRITVVASGETPSAADLADTEDALYAMMASWEAGGLSGDVVPFDKRYEQAIIAMLAVRVAEDFGKTPGPVLLRDAQDGWNALQGAFFSVPRQQFDRSLKYTGPRHAAYFDGQIEALSLWQSATDYQLRDTVSNGYNIYECTTAGTSGTSGGPTGTGDGIADGSIVWVWRRVDGSRNAIITLS